MKTFETEKNNMPEGATHYSDENNNTYFCWFMGVGTDSLMVMSEDAPGVWVSSNEADYANDNIQPIPQTKEVEWENGDEVVISKSSKSKWFVVGVSPVMGTSTVCVPNTGELKSFHTSQLKKPETPEAKKEREELEAAYDLFCTGNKELNTTAPCTFFEFADDKLHCDFFLAIVRKTGYRVEK